MESFIVHIYRKGSTTEELVGTFEDINRRITQPFRSYPELKRALDQAIGAVGSESEFAMPSGSGTGEKRR